MVSMGNDPEEVGIAASVTGFDLYLQAQLILRDGVPQIYLERVNKTPLYVVGGIISNGINRGLDELFEKASFELDKLEIQTTEIAYRAAGEATAIAVPSPTTTGPMPTVTLRPSPTAPR